MFLCHTPEKILVEVIDMKNLWNPFVKSVLARAHAGEEMQEPEMYPKDELSFPSGESLPQAWMNPQYRSDKSHGTNPQAFAVMS